MCEVLGRIAMGSIAAGRQTGSSFSVYLAGTNPSTRDVETIPESGGNGHSAAVTEKIAHLPHVRRVEGASLGLSVLPVKPNGTPDPTRVQLRAFELTKVVAVGSLTGLYFDQDRVSVVNGRMADPRSPDEAVMTAEAAHLLGLHLGEVIPLGFYTNEQNRSGRPHLRVDVRIVGLVAFNDAVIQDQVNRFPTDIPFTPHSLAKSSTPARGFPCTASMGSTPALLASGVAIGAIVALGLTLTASVRRRRRDLALLKTFGFTKRQLGATVAWQSSVAVLIGIIVGVPVGIIIGRFFWDLFAHEVNVVPAPSVPVLSVVLIAVGALVLANFVAAFPGRLAARTTTALVLRPE